MPQRFRGIALPPGPLETTAECEQEFLPRVRMTVQSDVVGLDEDDAVIWIASSFSNPQGLIQQDTAGCIQADISRVPTR